MIVEVFIVTIVTSTLPSTIECLSKFARLNATGNYKSLAQMMVYFVPADDAKPEKTHKDKWLCAGVIVTETDIVTSAACMEDIRKIYAVAAFEFKYVDAHKFSPSSGRLLDKCYASGKKRVVRVCVPKDYRFSYEHPHRWAGNDIAVAKVESPYTFYDTSKYMDMGCSYAPIPVKLNFDINLERAFEEYPYLHPKIMVGFGTNSFREASDDFFSPSTPRVEFINITDKKTCHYYYGHLAHDFIQKYMICGGQHRPTSVSPGFCHGDHGGPILSYVDETKNISEIRVIGIMSSYIEIQHTGYPNTMCYGPFLFTSTAANEEFLNCVIYNITADRRSCNEKPPMREKLYDWKTGI